MNEHEVFNTDTLWEDIKIVHYLLSKRGITDWFDEYDDLVQDILLMTIDKAKYFDSSKGNKNTFLGIMINQVLSLRSLKTLRGVSGTGMEEISTEDMGLWDIPLSSENIETKVYAEEVFSKLTEIQQMQACGYTFKEIAEETGLSADYIRNKLSLAVKNREEKE